MSRGRQAIYGKRRVVAFRLDDELDGRLAAACRRFDLSRQSILERSLRDFLTWAEAMPDLTISGTRYRRGGVWSVTIQDDPAFTPAGEWPPVRWGDIADD